MYCTQVASYVFCVFPAQGLLDFVQNAAIPQEEWHEYLAFRFGFDGTGIKKHDHTLTFNMDFHNPRSAVSRASVMSTSTLIPFGLMNSNKAAWWGHEKDKNFKKLKLSALESYEVCMVCRSNLPCVHKSGLNRGMGSKNHERNGVLVKNCKNYEISDYNFWCPGLLSMADVCVFLKKIVRNKHACFFSPPLDTLPSPDSRLLPRPKVANKVLVMSCAS
jgi:hypothetical protein